MSLSFLRLPATLEHLAIGKTTLYARISQGTFPPPVKFGDRVSAWPQHEVEAIMMAIMRNATEDELREVVVQLVKQRAKSRRIPAVA